MYELNSLIDSINATLTVRFGSTVRYEISYTPLVIKYVAKNEAGKDISYNIIADSDYKEAIHTLNIVNNLLNSM